MKVQRIVVGDLEENCYLLVCDGQALLIDPGSDFASIKEAIGDLKLLKILVTHNHFDHVGCVQNVIDTYSVDVFHFQNLQEKEYKIGPFVFQVLFTPGHSFDSVTYYFEKEEIMFVGDFVFAGTVGRCDLPTGNFEEMKRSIHFISTYPKNTIFYPGHGDSTILEKEIRTNPYFSN